MVERHDRLAQGRMDVGDGNSIAWWTIGNPDGAPIVVLHGGPGSGTSSTLEALFDLDRFHVVLFDQRQCGLSTPHASEPTADLSTNTTPHLLADIERLRNLLDIRRWSVFGASWGSTLALAYAQRHHPRVEGVVLCPVTTSSRTEIEWLYHGVRAHLPEPWRAFVADFGEVTSAHDIIGAYRRLLDDADASVRAEAAARWCEWEEAVVTANPNIEPSGRYDDPRWNLAFARIVTHYFWNDAWLPDNDILENASSLAGIPGYLIHGTDDLSARIEPARAVAAAWPGSTLVELPGAGHSIAQGPMRAALDEALDDLASRIESG